MIAAERDRDAERLIDEAGEPPADIYAEIDATLDHLDRTVDALCELLGRSGTSRGEQP